MLILKDIIKNYEVPVLGPIDVEIKSKSFVSIIGASGSGKSTFLRLASGLISQSSGSISYKNNIKPKMGFVFQDSTLLPWRNVIDNVLLPSELTKQNNSESIEKSINWLERVGLKGKENSFPNELSGGEQQRACLARAIIKEPDVLLTDEPTGNLDPIASFELVRLLESIHETGTTILMASHNYNLIKGRGRPILELKDGLIRGR